ncbi:MAG TPA: hypothetical protein DIV86_05165 [Alphaproteobacteria bacterium]|nr:hypothetical protein [Alphaproteobacteria bacterium]
MKTITVTSFDSGLTLQKWLKKNDVPFALANKFFRKKLIKVNKVKATKDTVLQTGDEILMPEIKEERQLGNEHKEKYVYEITKQDAERHFHSRIIYEDENIIAIDKEQGIATQGGNKVKVSIDGILQKIAKHSGKQYFIVHRLDKDTSGVLLIAKNRQTAQKLGVKFKNRKIEKTYLAIVVGKVLPMEGSIDVKIGKVVNGDIEKMVIDEADGKKAITDYKVLEHFGKTASLVEIYPQTGRKHQIRVHFAAIEHPILGDGKYGGTKAFIEGLGKTMHLHSYRVGKCEKIIPKTIEAPIPERFNVENR